MLYIKAILLLAMASKSLSLWCYECSSMSGEGGKCDSSNYGKSVQCDEDSTYCKMVTATTPLGSMTRRKCGGDGIMGGIGLKVQDYCAQALGGKVCYCTTNNCNTVYNPNTKSSPLAFGGAPSVAMSVLMVTFGLLANALLS